MYVHIYIYMRVYDIFAMPGLCPRIASEDLAPSQHGCKPTGCMQWFKAYVLGCKDFGSGLAVLV